MARLKRLAGAVLSATFGVLFFSVLAASAGEVSGTVKKVDAGKNTVVVTVDGKDKTFTVSKDVSILGVQSGTDKKGKATEKVATIDTLSGLTVGAKVAMRTDTVDSKEVVIAIKMDGLGETPTKVKAKKNK
jgi:hypothetical protein